QLPLLVEADAGVGPINLLLDDEVLPLDFTEAHAFEALVAFLEARAFDVLRPRVFDHLEHGRRASDGRSRRGALRQGGSLLPGRLLGLLPQRLDPLLQFFAQARVLDKRALVVDEIHGRPAIDAPPGRDGASRRSTVPE